MKASLYPTQKTKRPMMTAILVGVQVSGNHQPPKGPSLEELAGLATTAHYRPVATLMQKLPAINPKTFIGSGKVQELVQAVKHFAPDAVIFDEALTPAQTRNLENILKCPVVDRAWIILEIFRDHARTREAKTQVALAQLKYSLPRLTRMWSHLSRQRGGIGMRDVGEKQIQLDRRYIRDQINKLEKQLKQIQRERQTQRKSRREMYQVSLVGYTNVGKSTLMNLLTGAQTTVEDKLFATLDATVRKVKKNFPYPILLADTVGLIDKLPHDLVASFKSTLDEVRDADLLLNVVDISHPDFRRQMETTERLLREIGAADRDTILVFNKIDRLTDTATLNDMKRRHPEAAFVSCHTGAGIEDLKHKITQHYERHLLPFRLELDYDQSKIIPEIRKHALIVQEQYDKDSVKLDLRIFPTHQTQFFELLDNRAQPAG